MGRTKQTKKASLAASGPEEAGQEPDAPEKAEALEVAAEEAAPGAVEDAPAVGSALGETTDNPVAGKEESPDVPAFQSSDPRIAVAAAEGVAEGAVAEQPGGNGAVEGGPAGADVEMEPENPIPTDSAPQAGAAGEGLPEGGEVTLGDGLPAGGVAAPGEGEQDPIAAQMALVAEDFPAGQELFAPARPSSGGTPQEPPRKGGRGGKRKAANSEDGTPGLEFEGSEKKKPVYFEWAKKIWETEDTFKLPDGTHWPYVIEGAQGEEHGAVICKLCQRHNKTNNFAGEGYKKGKRSALVDHQTKNREHKLLVEAMETSLKRVVLLAGVPQRLLGKVAIVTGAAKGIGLACAACLGNEGAKVVVADVDDVAASRAVQQLQLEGVVAAAAKCDVTQKQEVEQLVAWTVETYGSLDIMVANAGIVKGADFLDFSEEDWDDVLNVNLKGPFICGQVAARQMVAQNESGMSHGGSIINMSSVNAVVAIPTICSYNASKGGLNNLTRCMAVSLAPHNIRVNAIGPGSIMTEVLQAVANNKKDMEKVLSRTPLGRVGDPYEIGQICTFLASDASSYITGQVIYADGGRMALNYTVPTKEA